MANDFSAVAPVLIAQGLTTLRGKNVMPRLVNSDFQGKAEEKNAVINVTIPSAVAVTDVVPAATAPQAGDSRPTSIPIVLDQWKEAAFYMTDKEAMEALEGTMPDQAQEAIKALANHVNGYLLSFYKEFYGVAGTAGTTPFATDVRVAADARKVANKQLCPTGDRRFVLDLDAGANALSLPLFQQANTAGTTAAQVEGMIDRKMGMDWFEDEQVGRHESTALSAGALTTNGVQAAGLMTISLAKATNASPLVKGDILTIAGNTHVVTAPATLAVGNTNVSIYPPLPAQVAGGAAVTLLASHACNMMFHRDAITFASRPLVSVTHPSVLTASAVDPVSGISLRMQITREYQRTRFAYDMLFGAKVLRPEFGVRVLG